MAPAHQARRPSAGARRAGYGLAILFSTALLIIVNGSPGWQAIPFLTSDTAQVLWLVNLCLAAGIAANLVYLAYDPAVAEIARRPGHDRDRAGGGDPDLAGVPV